MNLPEPGDSHTIEEKGHWPTWEVFVQKKTGQQHAHAGIVHAPNGEMALVFAKEQFGRRGPVNNIWVVASQHIYATEPAEADSFNGPDKQHREAGMYKVKEKIKSYKERNHGPQ
jgi:ring-1,2-phenylacetyl-CoA epoxidase subunit PaaB